MVKLSLKTRAPGEPPSVPSTPIGEIPPVQTPGTSGRPKIKLKSSQPPTPANETAPPLAVPLGPPPTKPKRPYNKKIKEEDDDDSRKRPAQDDIAPNPKRPSISLNISRRNSILQDPDGDASTPKIKIKHTHTQDDRRASGPKKINLLNRRAAPPKRPVGVGYDSEASDAEVDPLIESQFVLRMQPGDDCDYLRDAIANKTMGLPLKEGGADIRFKFLDKDHRRIILTIRGKSYAAAMVDLPCIIEGMKSWDKRGWWKVADICQMMLVLGPTENDDTAKVHPLPKEVDKRTWAYAHGLTPPMHYVRKRRFRKRASYKTVEHIDEEVAKLLELDREAESATYRIIDDTQDAAADEEYDDEDEYDDEPENYMSTTENGYGQYVADPEEDDQDFDDNLEAELMAGLNEDAEAAQSTTTSTPLPPLPVADAAANLGAVETAIAEATTTATVQASAAQTPTAQQSSDNEDPGEEGDYSSSDEDDDDDDEDDDEPEAIDEDVVERQREREGQMQDIEELERRILQARHDISTQTNPLLRMRKVKTLEQLDEELRVKKRAAGLGDEDDA